MKRRTLARILSHSFALIVTGLLIWGIYTISPDKEDLLDTPQVDCRPNRINWLGFM